MFIEIRLKTKRLHSIEGTGKAGELTIPFLSFLVPLKYFHLKRIGLRHALARLLLAEHRFLKWSYKRTIKTQSGDEQNQPQSYLN